MSLFTNIELNLLNQTLNSLFYLERGSNQYRQHHSAQIILILIKLSEETIDHENKFQPIECAVDVDVVKE